MHLPLPALCLTTRRRPCSKAATLTWNAALGAGSYTIYRGVYSGLEASTLIATGWAQTNYTDNGLTDTQTYFYTVKAVTNGVVSNPSNEASATANQIPLPPTNLVIASTGNGAVALTWALSSTATGYNIYRGTSPGAEGTTPIATGVSGSPCPTAPVVTNAGSDCFYQWT